MRTRIKVLLGLLLTLLLLVAAGLWFLANRDAWEPSKRAYAKHCASCHGAALEGGQGPALVDVSLQHGASTAELMASIRDGEHAYGTSLPLATVKALALYIAERRLHWPSTAASHTPTLPQAVISSQHHQFTLETVATLDDRPYSLAPLPDGRFLVTGKLQGLAIIDSRGSQPRLVSGTPRAYGSMLELGNSYLGLGWHLDVALHPEHANNGWIYLSHTHRCQLDCGSVLPVSMVRVVRGRLDDKDNWVDQEVIWSVHRDHYTPVPDQVACGRLAFGHDGSLFVTVGGKAPYKHLHNLDTPYGKVHRVLADGQVPEDNPFWQPQGQRPENSTRHTVWSYGHRTAQGLGVHPRTGELWQTEMGPRGGDEVNSIQAGGNYGWPLYTKGLDYNGKPVAIGTDLGLDFALEDTILPVADFTPAPAISGFTFATGSGFPGWQDDLLVGSLKAQTLYRLRIQDGKVLEQETLLSGLARIRDLAVGPDGLVYLLLEHGRTGSLVRLVPVAYMPAAKVRVAESPK